MIALPYGKCALLLRFSSDFNRFFSLWVPFSMEKRLEKVPNHEKRVCSSPMLLTLLRFILEVVSRSSSSLYNLEKQKHDGSPKAMIECVYSNYDVHAVIIKIPFRLSR